MSFTNKSHPFEEATAKESLKLIKKEFDGLELNQGILDDIIRGCLKQKPKSRLSLCNIKRMLKDLVVKEGINLEHHDVRRSSYGLMSPTNKNFSLKKPESSGTEKLDEESKDQINKDVPQAANFFQILNPDAFNTATYDTILYNEKAEDDVLDEKAKFRCVNVNQNIHDGPVNGVAVIETGIVVTSGNDKTIKFWNPMDNECIAQINEKGKVSTILTIPKVRQFYYVMGSLLKSFDYSIGVATIVYEGKTQANNIHFRKCKYYMCL
jgi:hypothetical protein